MAKKRTQGATASAVHISGESLEVVGILNLRVVIVQDGKFWFAQGLDIDYAAQGESVEDAREKFDAGLAATIEEHLKMYGTIENLLQVAPQSVWKELFYHPSAQGDKFSQVSVHRIAKQYLPFQGIQYMQLAS